MKEKTLKCKHLSYKKTSLIKNVLFEDNSIYKKKGGEKNINIQLA